MGDQILAIDSDGTVKSYTDPSEFLNTTSSTAQFDFTGDAQDELHATGLVRAATAPHHDCPEYFSDEDVESVSSLPDDKAAEDLETRRIGDIGLYKYMIGSVEVKRIVIDVLLCMFTVLSSKMLGESR